MILLFRARTQPSKIDGKERGGETCLEEFAATEVGEGGGETR